MLIIMVSEHELPNQINREQDFLIYQTKQVH